MFQTARFRIHNPSRHKAAVLRYAMETYHRVLKRMLESALADPRLAEKISREEGKGNRRGHTYRARKLLYPLAPRRRGNNYSLLVRLFARGHRYRRELVLAEGFVDCRTGEAIGGRKYPGLVLPLEFSRDDHANEYLQHGRPQSAKLVIKPADLPRAKSSTPTPPSSSGRSRWPRRRFWGLTAARP